MPAQILVPLDGSALAESALPQAQAVAHATGRGLTLVRVIPTSLLIEPVLALSVVPDSLTELQVADLNLGAGYLQTVAGRLPGPVQTAILEGDPATAIVEYALQHPDVTMIAMATHGRTRLGRWVLGSVAEAVLHTTPVPLLLTRPGSTLPPVIPPPVYRTILVPLDGSAFAEQALDPACELAAATGAALVLLTVDGPPPNQAGAAADTPPWIAEDGQNAVLHLEEYLRATTARLAAAGFRVVSHLVQGQAAVAILDASELVQADLIVMATHGRRGFRRLRLGSVALAVVHDATRPVLLYRQKTTLERQAEARQAPSAAVPAGRNTLASD